MPAAQLHLFPALRGDVDLDVGGAWLSYSVDKSRLSRHVRKRDGSTTTSSIRRVAKDGDLAADFDLSWLRSKSAPFGEATGTTTRVADLFAGCGAMSLGMAEACRGLGSRFDSVFAAEIDPVKASVYSANLNPREIQIGPLEDALDGDLGAATTLTERALMRRVGDVDVLIGGPPCQGHSDLNNHTRRNDARNRLVTRMARFAELFRPQHVVVENVQGVKHDRHKSASTSAKYLQSLGYNVEEVLVACAELGVPQTRRRYMLLASLKPLDSLSWNFSKPVFAERPVSWALSDLVDQPEADVFNSAATHSPENERRIRYLFEKNLFDLPDEERPPCHRLKVHAYKSVYGRMKWDEMSPTITTGFGSTGQGRFVHPLKARTLTPREAARLQTIPDFFKFGEPGRTQLQKMIGNSVPPLAMAAVGLHLLR